MRAMPPGVWARRRRDRVSAHIIIADIASRKVLRLVFPAAKEADLDVGATDAEGLLAEDAEIVKQQPN